MNRTVFAFGLVIEAMAALNVALNQADTARFFGWLCAGVLILAMAAIMGVDDQTPRGELVRTYARTLAKGSSFIALGIAIGVVLSRWDIVARALACAALVVEIGSAVVVMRRGLRAVDRIAAKDSER